jgi:hypothetical protein
MRHSSFACALTAVLALAALVGAACFRSIDVATALTITDVTSGYFDAGIVQSAEGEKNKLVPSISFRLKNVDQTPVSGVQVNAVFRRLGEAEEWGSSYVLGIGPEGLEPGQSTQPLVVRCPLGYTGLQPRAQMLQNHEFVDAKVQIFAKHGSANWVKLGEYVIVRQLLTH